MPRECEYRWHNWDSSYENRPGYEKSTLFCRNCGVGHTLEITTLSHRSRRVNITTFPATGQRTITREVLRFFTTACEATIREMERDSIEVIRGVDTLLGEPMGF